MILSETEGTPAAWPNPPDEMSAAAWRIEPAVVWDRLEAWSGRRWGLRSYTAVVAGPLDHWAPAVEPFTFASAESWGGDAFTATTLRATALGGVELTGRGPYRVTGVIGSADPPPPVVLEAYRRLAEYFASPPDRRPGSSSEATDLGGLSHRFERSPAWMARAMQNSGAADLLRPYRRAR